MPRLCASGVGERPCPPSEWKARLTGRLWSHSQPGCLPCTNNDTTPSSDKHFPICTEICWMRSSFHRSRAQAAVGGGVDGALLHPKIWEGRAHLLTGQKPSQAQQGCCDGREEPGEKQSHSQNRESPSCQSRVLLCPADGRVPKGTL